MTDRAAELEAVLRVWDSDNEIGNAAVAATTFHGANGASGANFVVEVMLLSYPVARLIAPPNAKRLRRKRWVRLALAMYDRLKAMRARGESHSDVILRLAKTAP